MVTYVINTSENKTFDSDQLFRLVGYNKIQWLNCSLDNVQSCIDFIKNKQGAIEAEEFRIAFLIDFYGFDRIRPPYGRRGYGIDQGVECSLYLPYIEAYLKDSFLYILEKQEYYPAECDVFYIKSGNFEVIENIENLEEQVKQIVSPDEDSFVERRKVYFTEEKEVYVDENGKIFSKEEYEKAKSDLKELNDKLTESVSKKEKAELLEKIQSKIDFIDNVRRNVKKVRTSSEEDVYEYFKLYCTKNITLKFKISDFPYGLEEKEMNGASEREFFLAFCNRAGKNRKIRRHFYHTSVGGSVARAAFDNLALSLHLIRLYEREDRIEDEGDVEINAVDSDELKNLLVTAWNKIMCARKVARENKSLYFSLKQISDKEMQVEIKEEKNSEQTYREERAKISVQDKKIRESIDTQYKQIMDMGKVKDGEFIDDDKQEFNKILSEYLKKRDEMSEKDVDVKFKELINSNSLETTSQCPSKQEYDFVLNEKYDQISKLMSGTLGAEYSTEKFDQEQKSAKKIYQDYLAAKKILTRNVGGDILFLILTVLIMMVPFIAIKSIVGFTVGTVLAYVLSAGVFAGLFIVSLILTIMPYVRKMKTAKQQMLECYKNCLAKKKVALAQLKRRYEVDLINIEEFRYEIRQISLLYQLNLEKDKNVNKHRVVLEEVENCLSSILNNLGIHPTVDENQTIEGEFNLMKSIRSPENKVYKIFSLDAIETLLIKNNSEVI